MTKDDKFEYFMEKTDQSLEKIEAKVDNLMSFKFMLIGASGLASFIINLVFLYFEKHN